MIKWRDNPLRRRATDAADAPQAADAVPPTATPSTPPTPPAAHAAPTHDHDALAAERPRIAGILSAVTDPAQLPVAVGMIRSGADIGTARRLLAGARTAGGVDPWFGLHRALGAENAVAADTTDTAELAPGQVGAYAAALLYGPPGMSHTPHHLGEHDDD